MDITLLNKEQRRAVECLDGPLLVLAGAGSGKTRVLTYRIANLIDHGVRPWNILALTFTNKAAREMRERTESLIGVSASDVWCVTFHSFCVRILRMDIDKMSNGYDRNFVIYDDGDQLSVIESILKRLGVQEKDTPKRSIKEAISTAKNKGVDPDTFFASEFQGDLKRQVYSLYKKQLQDANALDFDDLILFTIKLFQQCGDVLEKYRGKFRYVLVDEYQDTNLPQYSLVRLLCEEHRNLCVVGDDDQSIYGWRGADIRNILEFETDFPGAKIIRLEQNYRSSANILNAANSVIANNIGRKEKRLWTNKASGDTITHHCADDERREADFVCRTIMSGIRSGRAYCDYAVLYRMNAQSRILETMLLSYGIPHNVYGGQRFYDRKEIKDILAYLRVVANPNDDVAFRRIVNVPARGIGAATLQKLTDAAVNSGSPLLVTALGDTPMDLKTAAKLKPFRDMMAGVLIKKAELPPSELTEYILGQIRYREYLELEGKTQAETRWENILELMGNIREVENSIVDPEADALGAFLESVALMSDIDSMSDEYGTVSLMTLHSAKGLEFGTVFITGMEDGIFPTSRSKFDPDSMEEERRLMYVGMTRAMDKLYLLNTRHRTLFGHTSDSIESRFLREIPEEFLEIPSALRGFGRAADEYNYGRRPSEGLYEKQSSVPAFAGSSKYEKHAAVQMKDLSIYQRVRHAKFGEGTIIEMTGSGNAILISIDFDSVGVKKLAGAYAPIEPVE